MLWADGGAADMSVHKELQPLAALIQNPKNPFISPQTLPLIKPSHSFTSSESADPNSAPAWTKQRETGTSRR